MEAITEPPLEGEVGNIAVAPRVKIWQHDRSPSFRPQGKIDGQRGRGLERGFRVDYAWTSTIMRGVAHRRAWVIGGEAS